MDEGGHMQTLKKISFTQQITTIILCVLAVTLNYFDQKVLAAISTIFVMISLLFHWLYTNRKMKEWEEKVNNEYKLH